MKRDNRGASLIEIIVAVTILVLCAVPLFKSMILSAQMNAKSRQLLAATNTAEAVMENLKADGMEEFIRENQGSTDIAEVSYLDENDKKAGYSFVYPEYEMDKQKFRVQVEVRPYKNEDAANDYNSKDVANIYRMNRTTDAIYTEETSTVEEDYLKAVSSGAYTGEEKDEVLDNLEVHYDYEISADEDRQRVEQTVRYLYHGTSLGEHLTLLYDSNQIKGTLYNLYLFFEPGKKNIITIHNPDDYPLEIYLIKQGEKKMDLKVDIRGTTLLQNLGEEKDPDFTKGVRIRTNFTDITDRTEYSYSQRGTTKDNFTDGELKKYFSMKLLDDQRITYRLYDVTVQVMKNTEQITTLTGTVTR